MKSNESTTDRILRAVVGAILLYLALAGTLVGGLAVAAGILGAILLLTGATGFCPLYRVLNFTTIKR